MDRKQLLEQILSGKGRELCTPEGQNKVDRIANRNNPSPTDYNNDADYFDSLYLNESSMKETSGNGMAKPDLDAIRASMASNPIGVSEGGSVLDAISVPNVPPRRTPVREQVNYAPATSQPYMGNGIDYSIIKAIFNECLNDYFSKHALNESSTLKGIAIDKGVITLIDNSGNIFKAKLTKVQK